MPVFIKRVEAVKYDGSNIEEIKTTLKASRSQITEQADIYGIFVCTIGSDCGHAFEIALPGDWVLKNSNGSFRVMKPDIFEASYEPLPTA